MLFFYLKISKNTNINNNIIMIKKEISLFVMHIPPFYSYKKKEGKHLIHSNVSIIIITYAKKINQL